MKKVLSLVIALGALACTASAAPYYTATPTPGALTPYDWQPVYSIEGAYNFVNQSELPNTYGLRANFSLYNSGENSVRHQFGITLGYEQGAHSTDYLFPYLNDVKLKTRRELYRIPLTLGYDINLGITDNVFIDLGAKGGYAWGSLEDSIKTTGSLYGASYKADLSGFTYGLGVGVKVQFSESIYTKIGYEFSRTFFDASGSSNVNYGQHSIILSAGCQF